MTALRIAVVVAAVALTLSLAAEARNPTAAGQQKGAPGKPRQPGGKPQPGAASAQCQKPSRAIPGANECTIKPPSDCIAPAGGGRLIAARTKVYEAQKDLTVWRVYGMHDPPLSGGNRLTGAWWTLMPVREKTKDDYASNYAVCRDWNAMKHLAKCRIKKGARFSYGDGQSLFFGTCKTSAQLPIPSKWHKKINGKDAIAPPAHYKQVCIPQAGNRMYSVQGGKKKPVYQSAPGVNLDVECDGYVVSNPPAAKLQ